MSSIVSPCGKDRRKIATVVKFLVSMNALPAEYKHQLHSSQISRYKNHFDPKCYFGNDLMNVSDQVVDMCRKVNQYTLERSMVYGFLRLSFAIRKSFSGAKHFHKTLLQNKDQIVETVQRIQHSVSVEKCARIIGVGYSTLRGWITSVRVRCSGSVINLCRKVHSSQLTIDETNSMKKLLEDESMLHWPLVSVYYHALHNKIVSMSLSTWYKYADLLNIKRMKPRKSKHYGDSVTATMPNQYWHADVTQFRTRDGALNYIYLVVDNYSRMILSWAVSTKLSAKIRTDTFRDALKTAMRYHPLLDTINLVVDGGSENNNTTVDDFISSITDIEINKIRALKDVCFSNAHAEAINKTVKTCYLNQKDILDTKHLITTMEQAVFDITTVRPHGRIGGLIPLDCYMGKTIEPAVKANQLVLARKERIRFNQNNSCNKCFYQV